MLFRDRALISLETVDSTNNYAASLIRLSKPPEGTVITAQEQTAGRGQRGNQWSSARGENLLCSLILYPGFLGPGDSFALSECISLSVAEWAGSVTGRDAWIKWPNDIIAGHRKIAGILIEFSWNEQRAQSAICGIGINLNQQQFPFSRATSLKLETGRLISPLEALEGLLTFTDRNYIRLKSGQREAIRREYHERLYRRGEECRFLRDGKEFSARLTGTDHRGRILLDTGEGPALAFEHPDVTLVL